jgi:hypothetical protein
MDSNFTKGICQVEIAAFSKMPCLRVDLRLRPQAKKCGIVHKQKIIPFLPGKDLDPIHRHLFGRIEIIVELLYLSRQVR